MLRSPTQKLRDELAARAPIVPPLPSRVVPFGLGAQGPSPDNMEIIGSRFGHIRIVDILGQGGMGNVYAGYDETLHRRVAVKAIKPEQRLEPEARSRLIREARTLSQLDHPNICRIYDYIEGEDQDLLVLELIEGRTLEQAIADGLPKAERLRVADAIARVLVAAHRAGIIHRDLKPENVMITGAGEVKVLDFGLARWAEKPASSGNRYEPVKPESIGAQLQFPAEQKSVDDWFLLDEKSTLVVPPPAVVHPPTPGRRDLLATAAGVAMGTPLYMSPEQARGETLTPASDMYSFGLMLQTLFTGKEPYDSTMTARDVMIAASRGESLAMSGADRDITALVNRLKQLAPTDRPTAVEALERLRSIAEKPKRIARQVTVAAALLILILGTWKYLTDLRRERAAAVAAQQEAEKRRAQAEDLIGFMLGDLRTKLEPVGRLEVLNDVAAKALQYVGSKPKDALSFEELIDHSKALNQLGDVRSVQGDLAASMKLFQQSLDLAETAVRREPKNDDAKYALALSHFWIGNNYRLQKDVKDALPHMEKYREITEELARRHPDNEKYQREAAYPHSLLGLLHEAQGDFNAAKAEYRTTLAIKQAYAARHPNDDGAQDDVATTLNKLAYVLNKQGDFQSARETYEAEVAIRERLLARDPQQMQWKTALAISHSMLSRCLEDLGDEDGALQHRRADIALNTELCTFDSTNKTWQRNLAVGHLALARLLGSRNQNAEAMNEVRTAESSLQRLLLIDPSRVGWREDLLVAETTHARLLLAQHEVRQARVAIEDAIRNGERLNGATSTKTWLASAYLTLGNIEQAEGKTQAAKAAWTKARDTIGPIAPVVEVRHLDTYARALLALGDRNEATPVVARLRSLGYRNHEFESLLRSEGF